jgi:predicted acyl esterase
MKYSIRLTFILFFYFQTQPLIDAVSYMYAFTTENVWLLMPDGVRLSASLTIPIPKYGDEKFPVLLEYKPYQKDDSFYNFNQPNTYYMARRGFIVSQRMAYTLDICMSFVSGS